MNIFIYNEAEKFIGALVVGEKAILTFADKSYHKKIFRHFNISKNGDIHYGSYYASFVLRRSQCHELDKGLKLAYYDQKDSLFYLEFN